MLSSTFDISTQYVSVIRNTEDKLMWSSATETDLQNYKYNLNEALLKCHFLVDALYCNDHFCVEHGNDVLMFHDGIINACLSASKCLPHSKNNKLRIPGWKEFVGPYRKKLYFGMNYGRKMSVIYLVLFPTFVARHEINIITY